MAVELGNHGASDTLLENVWASFIAGSAHEGTGGSPSSYQAWEEFPPLQGREGSARIVERIPSIGRLASMSWEEMLEGITPISCEEGENNPYLHYLQNYPDVLVIYSTFSKIFSIDLFK